AGVLVSVDLSLSGSGSSVPAGGVTSAVLTRSPVKPDGTDTITVYTMLPPFWILTDWLILPEPLAIGTEALFTTAVHVPVVPAGSTSVTVAPTTSEGPLLRTVTV